ncbi:MAG: aminodeoxychorismate synthase component I [Legionella sp.]|nr:aminodeoxychorismate synthase component I [Legionella sp.]
MSQFVSLSLDYCSALQEQYQKLCHLPGFVLLESTDCSRGRYDIVSACPYDAIKIDQNTQNLSVLVGKLSDTLSVHDSVIDLPFQGGALGYISYDLGAKLLGIESKIQPSLAGMPLLDLGLYDWAIIADHFLKKITLFAANTQTDTPKLVDEILSLWNGQVSEQAQAVLNGDFTPLMEQCDYEQSFIRIHNALMNGRSYQVNFTQPFHARFEGDTWAFYRKVSRINPVPFSAFLRTENAEILSFSPERFLSYDNGHLLTSPIKGTIGRSGDPVEDEQLKAQLSACEKNKAENVMIVDLLRNDLGKIAETGSVRVSSLCEIESYNSVHHLVSTVEAQCLPEIKPFDAFLSCFPGGSITGAPKIESMRIIDEEEPYARGIYCGSIGYFSRHGVFDTNIAIRTITAREHLLHLAAGGGIVIDSNSEDEYRECFIKIAAVINGLK